MQVRTGRSVAVLVGLLWLALPGRAFAIPDTGFVISEIFFDVCCGGGAENNRQWIELYNGTGAAIPLDEYSLGWGRNSYTQGTFQLSGSLLPGETWIVGGPDSVAENYFPDFSNGQAVDLNQNLRLGDNGSWADGIGLFHTTANLLAVGSDPIHTVIYGQATASPRTWLTDESGLPGSGAVSVVLTGSMEGMSIALQPDGSWAASATPLPGVYSVPEPASGLLVLLGLGLFARLEPARRRGVR